MKINYKGSILGAAFLMATSAIGPGFLTQTSLFTQQLGASFGFVILVTIVLDIIAQLNIWSVLTITAKRAQDLSNQLLPGLGYAVSILIVLGGLAFNIGNIAGCGLGLNVLTGMDAGYGALISCPIALGIFWFKEAGSAIDSFTKTLGFAMILLTLFVAVSAQPPLMHALEKTFIPDEINSYAIITIVGGTIGGYISFAGAHRLIDAGLVGSTHNKAVQISATSGIVIAGIMRTILFLAVLGVVYHGGILDEANPPASVFKLAAGNMGYRFFGVIMWSAAITSVVGAAYTSISFIRTFHPWFEQHQRMLTSILIVLSTIIFIWFGKPVKVLVIAGAFNGLILPVTLAIILIASVNKRIMLNYRHPKTLVISGWIVVGLMGWLSIKLLAEWLSK